MCILEVYCIYTTDTKTFTSNCDQKVLSKVLKSVCKNLPKKHRTKRQRRLTCILDRKLQKYINEQIFISIYNYRWYKITVRN